jgi:hypothetical protein
MLTKGLEPRGEALRQALRWLSDNAPVTSETIDEAGRRFNLSPSEEEFLLKEYREQTGNPD